MRKYSESERQNHVAQYVSSGLSISEYCRRSNIPTSTFHKWIPKEKKGSFLPVVSTAVCAEGAGVIEVQLPHGIVLRLPV